MLRNSEAAATRLAFVSLLSRIMCPRRALSISEIHGARFFCFTRASDFDLSFKVEHARAFQFDAIAFHPTKDLAAAPRSLIGAKLCPAQSLGPIRGEHTVRSAGHGIFRDAFGWSKVPANKVVNSLAWRCRDHAGTINPR